MWSGIRGASRTGRINIFYFIKRIFVYVTGKVVTVPVVMIGISGGTDIDIRVAGDGIEFSAKTAQGELFSGFFLVIIQSRQFNNICIFYKIGTVFVFMIYKCGSGKVYFCSRFISGICNGISIKMEYESYFWE